jgi:hypothetical protein
VVIVAERRWWAYKGIGSMNDLNKLSCRMYFIVATLRPAMLDSDQLRKTKSSLFRGRCVVLLAVVGLLTSYIAAQETSSKCFGGVVIHGTVLDSGRKPVSDAVVRLEPRPAESPIETTTNAAGVFTFSSPTDRSYHLFAEKSGLRTPAMDVTAVSGNCIAQMELILNMPGPTPGSNTVSQPVVKAMEFADQPNFAIAGVTDWTAVGGHGSDSTLRTSESLASETRDLKPDIGGSSVAGVAPRVPEDTETETKLRAALAKAPRSFSENNRLGEYYLRIGRYTDAISILESAYKIDPNNDANQYELVSTYDKSGDLPRAINRIHELLKNSQSADLYRLAGELDEKAGDPLSSVHEYERAAILNGAPNYCCIELSGRRRRSFREAQMLILTLSECRWLWGLRSLQGLATIPLLSAFARHPIWIRPTPLPTSSWARFRCRRLPLWHVLS